MATAQAARPMTAEEKKVIFASSLGTVFEWYDFYLYGSLAAIIAKQFFSGLDAGSAFIFALLAFAAGFIVRPFGALVFGRLGDMIGRKYTFLVTILIMGLSTFIVGILPNYASIGVAAPVILIALRLLQGLALGGEYGGAATYVAEHAPHGKRGAYTAWIQTTATLGLFLSLMVILATRTAIGEEAFADWGWRIPFLVSVFLLAISVWIRLSMNESPAFQKMKDEGKNDFKVVYGLEAYVHPSIDQWKLDKEKIKEDAKLAKQIDDDVGLVMEDESETKKGIKNVLNQRSHLVLNAINQKGLNNLFKLVSTSYRGDNFYRFPRIDYSMLREHSEGIIASSACIGGVLGNDYWRNRDVGDSAVLNAMEKTVEAMMNIFGDRFYGELQWANFKEQHIINQFITQLSKTHGFQLVSTCDAHFPSPDMWKDREIYKMLGWMNKKKDELKIDALPSSLEEMEYQLYPKNGDELFAAYKNFSQRLGFSYDDKLVEDSIARTADILKNRIENYTPDTTIKLPNFVVPEGESADTALAKLVVENFKKSGLYVEQEYVDRLKEELHTIKDRGFSKYFLAMKTIVDESKERQLCGAGRGSGAGSLVSYLLNITEVDPIKYKLQFSRFIRKNAKDYPDIDFDVSDPMTIKEALIQKFGENSVVPISNYNTLQVRSLIKDISKLYEIPFQEVNDVTSKMLSEAIPPAKKDHGITAGVYNPTWEELKKYSTSLDAYLRKYPHVATHVENLQGQIRSISRHAGGVLFADNLNEKMPLIKSGDVVQTPWVEGQTVRHLEQIGRAHV